MTPEQFVAVMGAVTALVVALGAIYAQLRATHALTNSRMTELIKATHQSSLKEGELVGRDFAAGEARSAGPTVAGRIAKPNPQSPANTAGKDTPIPPSS